MTYIVQITQKKSVFGEKTWLTWLLKIALFNRPTAIPGETYSYDVPAYDKDGGRLTFTIDSVYLDKGFTVDELGRLRWTPETSDTGNHPVTITITDETGAEIEQSFTVEVVADTEAPKIDLYTGNIFVVNGEYQTDINTTVTFQAWATDNVGNNLLSYFITRMVKK